MTDKPPVGTLGYRFMGKTYSNALTRLSMFFLGVPDVERPIIVGCDEEMLFDAAERFDFESTAIDQRDVVDGVDAFYNLDPNHLHAEPSIVTLEAGADASCEEPLAPILDEAEAMRDAAHAADGIAGCVFNYHLVPAIRYARWLVESGGLGKIRHTRGYYPQDWLVDADVPWAWRMDKDAISSGALDDLGIHTIDLIRFLVSDRADDTNRISGHLQTFVDERPVPGEDEYRPVTTNDTYTTQTEFENGAVGSFEASRFVDGHKDDRTVEIHDSEGSLQLSLEHLDELEVKTGDARGYETALITDKDDPYLDHWWPPGHILGWEHMFVRENYEFLSAVAGSGDFSPSFEDGHEIQSILSTTERSDEAGKWVSLS